MIDWSRGYSSEYSLVRIDPKTWTAMNSVNKVASATINHDGTDDVPLLETASLTIDGQIEDGWYRVLMKASQNDINTTEALGTFHMTTSSMSYFGTARTTSSIAGSSVLKPCSTKYCRLGDWSPKGGNIAQWVQQMIAPYTPAPVRLGTDIRVAMGNYYVFDPGTKVIKAAWSALDDAEWCLQIDGNGVIWILPKPDIPKRIMDKSTYNILQPQFDNSPDREDTPNVYRVIYTRNNKDKEIEIINADPNSKISTVNRDFRIEEMDTNPSLLEGETYENYGKRQLKELTVGMDKWSYTREYIPDMRVFDLWDCRRTDIGMVGKGRILSQKLTCDKGVVVSEKVGIEVDDYAVDYVDLSDR